MGEISFEVVMWTALGVLALVVSLWAFYDLLGNRDLEDNQKMICLLLIFCTGPIGAIIYFMMNR